MDPPLPLPASDRVKDQNLSIWILTNTKLSVFFSPEALSLENVRKGKKNGPNLKFLCVTATTQLTHQQTRAICFPLTSGEESKTFEETLKIGKLVTIDLR